MKGLVGSTARMPTVSPRGADEAGEAVDEGALAGARRAGDADDARPAGLRRRRGGAARAAPAPPSSASEMARARARGSRASRRGTSVVERRLRRAAHAPSTAS